MKKLQNEPQRPGASEVCFIVGRNLPEIATNYFQMKTNVLK